LGYIPFLFGCNKYVSDFVSHRRMKPYFVSLPITSHRQNLTDWPGRYRRTLVNYPQVDLVADYVGPGEIIYWVEIKPSVAVPARADVPNKRLLRGNNWNPYVKPAQVLSWNQVCGGILIITGATIITVTIVENFATFGAGTVDDVITVPGGYYLINLGQRIATFVPAGG